MLRSSWPLSFMKRLAAGSAVSPNAITAQRFRINISAVQTSGSFAQISGIGLRSIEGGSFLSLAGATATASSTNGANVASNVLDGSTATVWQASSGSLPQTLEINMGTPVPVVEFVISSGGAISDAPFNFTLEYYNGSSWVVVKTVVGFRWRATATAKTFTIASVLTAAQATLWQLKEISRQVAGNNSNWAELEFRKTAGGADVSQSSTAWAVRANGTSVGTASNAFDNNTGTSWAGDASAGQSVGCEISSAGAIEEIVGTISANAGDGVTKFFVQYHNSETWVTYWIGVTAAWTASATQTIAPPSTMTTIGPYRYVLLEVVTTTNGFIGCSTLNVWGNGFVDYALQSAGGAASAVGYTVNGSFPVTRVNDNDDSVFTTSSSSAAAGSGHGIQIDLGQSRNFGKIGFRRRTDSFGSNEGILTGFVKAKLNIGDAWTTIYTVSESWPGSYEYREWAL